MYVQPNGLLLRGRVSSKDDLLEAPLAAEMEKARPSRNLQALQTLPGLAEEAPHSALRCLQPKGAPCAHTFYAHCDSGLFPLFP